MFNTIVHFSYFLSVFYQDLFIYQFNKLKFKVLKAMKAENKIYSIQSLCLEQMFHHNIGSITARGAKCTEI